MAELNNSQSHHHPGANPMKKNSQTHSSDRGTPTDRKMSKGRTGWPQHVWALELQQ